MSIEILKKHMNLAFKIYNIAFRLYIARGQKKKTDFRDGFMNWIMATNLGVLLIGLGFWSWEVGGCEKVSTIDLSIETWRAWDVNEGLSFNTSKKYGFRCLGFLGFRV